MDRSKKPQQQRAPPTIHHSYLSKPSQPLPLISSSSNVLLSISSAIRTMKIYRLQRVGKMESVIFVENVIFPFLFSFEQRPVECLPGHALMVRCTGAHTQILITLSFFSSSVFCNIWRFYWSITFWTVLLLPLCVVGHVVEIYLFDPFTKSFIFQHIRFQIAA